MNENKCSITSDEGFSSVLIGMQHSLQLASENHCSKYSDDCGNNCSYTNEFSPTCNFSVVVPIWLFLASAALCGRAAYHIGDRAPQLIWIPFMLLIAVGIICVFRVHWTGYAARVTDRNDQEGERAKQMENPTMRGPIEAAAQRYAVLAQKFEAARKRAT
jgi:hypothetical protein